MNAVIAINRDKPEVEQVRASCILDERKPELQAQRWQRKHMKDRPKGTWEYKIVSAAEANALLARS